MSVKLKVLHGALKAQGKLQVTVPIRQSPFVIGRGEDCQMRCFGTTISRQHCRLRVSGFDVFVADLHSRNGTYLNGERIDCERVTRDGDRLRIGKLEFELQIELPTAGGSRDPLGDYVSEMLIESDAAAAESESTSLARWYQIEPTKQPQAPLTDAEKRAKLLEKRRQRVPQQQKAPQPLPKRVAHSVNIAVEETLARYGDGLGRLVRRSGSSSVAESPDPPASPGDLKRDQDVQAAGAETGEIQRDEVETESL